MSVERLLEALSSPADHSSEPPYPQSRKTQERVHRERVAGRCVVCGSLEACACMGCGASPEVVCDCEGSEHMKPLECRVLAERVPMEQRARNWKEEQASAKEAREAMMRLAGRPQGVTVQELQEDLGRSSSTDKASLARSLKVAESKDLLRQTGGEREGLIVYIKASLLGPRLAESARPARSLPRLALALNHEAIAATYRAEDGEEGAIEAARERLLQAVEELSTQKP